jgi:hypothetical protein
MPSPTRPLSTTSLAAPAAVASIRDKLFFFGDYQGSRDHLGHVNRGALPGITFRSGNLAGGGVTIYDPLTGASSGAGRTAFTGGIIPASRISPIASRIIAFMPAPDNRSG